MTDTDSPLPETPESECERPIRHAYFSTISSNMPPLRREASIYLADVEDFPTLQRSNSSPARDRNLDSVLNRKSRSLSNYPEVVVNFPVTKVKRDPLVEAHKDPELYKRTINEKEKYELRERVPKVAQRLEFLQKEFTDSVPEKDKRMTLAFMALLNFFVQSLADDLDTTMTVKYEKHNDVTSAKNAEAFGAFMRMQSELYNELLFDLSRPTFYTTMLITILVISVSLNIVILLALFSKL